MKLIIAVPEKTILEKDVESVTLPGAAGQFTVMDGHDILIAELAGGNMFFRYTDSEGKFHREDYEIKNGYAEILKDKASILVKSAARI